MFFIAALEVDDEKRKRSSILRETSGYIIPFDIDIGDWAFPVPSNGLYE